MKVLIPLDKITVEEFVYFADRFRPFFETIYVDGDRKVVVVEGADPKLLKVIENAVREVD